MIIPQIVNNFEFELNKFIFQINLLYVGFSWNSLKYLY